LLVYTLEYRVILPFSLAAPAKREQKENLLCSLEHIGMLAALLCCQNKKRTKREPTVLFRAHRHAGSTKVLPEQKENKKRTYCAL
jgi:hypothetical protein